MIAKEIAPKEGRSASGAGTPRTAPEVAGGHRPASTADLLAKEAGRIRALERRQPLQRRILEALSQQPRTPTELAAAAGAELASVSRLLRTLRKTGLVVSSEVEGDKRQRLYTLAPEGRMRLTEHHAFGAPEPPPAPLEDRDAVEYLESAVANAVQMRRRTNRLEDAAERLRAVQDEADKRGAFKVALDATAALATTLSEQKAIGHVNVLLDQLQSIALGSHPSRDPTLVLPAAAYREHSLGHLPETHHGGDLRAKARHLDAAQSLFSQLRTADPTGERDWKQREAWTILSLASNFRKRSRLEEATEKAGQAITIFDDLDDAYGRGRCLLMYGLCFRLMGDFNNAATSLDEAYKLASANALHRLEAELLMQRGEVYRCQGENRQSREAIEEALALAERMDLLVTSAFARSALGAVACQERRLDEAQLALDQAQLQFEACADLEGLALNARRQAVVHRRLAGLSGQAQLKVARHLVRAALARYQELRSTAGITALEIEDARLTRIRGGQAKATINRLLSRLDDARERYLLELDPWVPKVFRGFADEVADPGLQDQTEELVAASERRIAAWTKQNFTRAVSAARTGAARAKDQVRSHTDPDLEMAGEPRDQRDYDDELSLVT